MACDDAAPTPGGPKWARTRAGLGVRNRYLGTLLRERVVEQRPTRLYRRRFARLREGVVCWVDVRFATIGDFLLGGEQPSFGCR